MATEIQKALEATTTEFKELLETQSQEIKQFGETSKETAARIAELEKSMQGMAEDSKERELKMQERIDEDRKSTRLNSSHVAISYAVFCLKKKTQEWRQK